MKYTICLLLVVTANLAYAQSGQYSKESETLAAQINVTRDTIAQMLNKLKSTTNGPGDGFSHPDFVAKSRQLNAEVEKAMIAFEATVTNDVLTPAQFWVDRLNAIAHATAYSSDQ